MNIALYTGFSKDINSTKRPTTESAIVADCTIFEPCSILHPSFILSAGGDAVYRNATYCYVPLWGRYYWVNDKQFIDGRFIITCDIDVLATYKVNIGATTQFVVRSASQNNPLVTDMAYTLTGEVKTLVKLQDAWTGTFAKQLSDGMFVVGIVGESNSSDINYGAVNYYGFSYSEFKNFITALMSNQNDWLNVQTSDLSDSTMKSILNPIQYITACYWTPFSPTYGTQSSVDIKFGWWTISGINHRILPVVTSGMPSVSGYIRFNTATSPRHPQADARGAYLNRAPYSEIQVYIPQVGYLPIPDDIYAITKSLEILYTMDYPTGNALLTIRAFGNGDYTGDVYEITKTTAKLAVNVPIAQLYVDTVGTVKSTVGAFAGVGGATTIGGIIAGLINGAVNVAVKASEPVANIIATADSLSGYSASPYLLMKVKMVSGDVPDIIGRPLCEPVQLATLSGYIQCATSHIAIANATKAEITQIETYMREGFYYE